MSITTISVPHERRLQIDQIAESFGTKTMSETLGEMIRVLARHGIVTTTLPGIEINRASDGLAIQLEGGERVGLPFEHAREFARQLRRYIESDERLGELLDMDADFGIGRKGNGVKVMLPVGGTWKFFSRDLARDLMERLEDQIPT